MSEKSAVQDPMVNYADDIGWDYVSPSDALALRGGETGVLFRDVLEAQLLKLNKGILDASNVADVIRRIEQIKPTIEGNKEALSWIRGEQSVFVPSENRERNVTVVDLENPDRNIFQVTDEWRHKGVAFPNRADVVFLINGIPVAIAETKAAEKSDGLAEGVGQIRRYHRETPEMLALPQVFEVTQMLDFFYGVTWRMNRKDLFNWRDEVDGDYERKIKAFFDRTRFLRVLREYIAFISKDDELSKIILRQHQTRAVEKVVERVADARKRRGLIWHTQGSGKTLTMMTIASKLLRDAVGEKPTVVMLVDRNELEEQLFKNLKSYGFGGTEVAESKRDLQRLLSSDYRGLIVSTIHKFDDIPANINTRETIVVLVDEAHRTTGGDLGNYLVAALPNATYIGFTGTPIDNLASGKGTFKVFGADDERGYLDKYSIAESIEDGTTVRLNYALAPSDLRVNKEMLEKRFWSLAEAEGVSDVEELNAILDRAVELKEAMKASDRIDKIAKFVAQHYRENVEPMGFKAFLVAVDREACALYKQALDKYLPAEYSQPVYSPFHNDDKLLKDFYLNEDEEKAVRREFAKKTSLPKILIVTEKLLTGFDAPILYSMYLDKPMRDHVLLQAIARVNRPYEDSDGLVKPYGFVLDFVGIFEKLEKALAFDSDVVASVIQNIDVLKTLFDTMMREQAKQYMPLAAGWTDKDKERAIEHFKLKIRRDEFFKFFKRLQSLYDIISPDAFLRPFIKDYQSLSILYALIRNAYADRVYVDKELTAKTKALLREHSSAGDIETPGAIHTLGPEELAALRGSDASDNTKVLNLRKILLTTVRDDSSQKPFLLSIGERAEAVALAYEDRQLTTQQALLEFQQLAQELVQADADRAALGLNDNAFAIYKTVKASADINVDQARLLDSLFAKYPDYRWDGDQAKSLRAELYRELRTIVGPKKMVESANALMRLERV